MKRFYKRVRKGKHVIGIGLQVRRERLIHRLRERNQHRDMPAMDVPNGSENLPTVPLEVTESLPPTIPSDHYQISSDTRQKVQLLQWLKTNETDPALRVCKIIVDQYLFSDTNIKDFVPRLKNHLLSRLLELRYSLLRLVLSFRTRRGNHFSRGRLLFGCLHAVLAGGVCLT